MNMKRILLLSATVSMVLLASSCQKEYHCGCTNVSNNSTTFYTIKDVSQAAAANDCLLKSDSTRDCSL